MRNLRLASLALFLLAGCASSGGVAEGTNQAVLARFPPGGAKDILQVTVTDRLQVRSAELVGPGGGAVPAYSINTEAPRYAPSFGGFLPSIGIGIGGGSGGVGGGVNIGFPLGGGGNGSSAPPATSVSNAYFQLPDRGLYLREWQNYRIRVELGWPPDSRTVEIAAPPPPT
jgi:hypothetical protein